MASNYQTLVYELPASAGAEGPSEFRIFAYGKTGTSKGDFCLDDEAAAECMRAYVDHGNRLTIDYEHMALSEPPQPAPAAASFVLELRNDGLWATDVKWSPKAAEMLRNKEYFYFSPAFVADKANRPTRILNVALTNIPATKNMQPLIAAKQTTEEPPMKTVLTALSLKESASEAEALSAITKLSDEHRRLLSATGKDSVEEAIGAVVALKSQADRVDALTVELNAVKADKEKAEVAGLLDEATKDGRISVAKRPEFESLCAESGIKALRMCLSMLSKAPAPAIPPGKDYRPAPTADGAVAGLSTDEMKIVKATGLTPEKFVAHKAAYRQAINPVEEK